MIMELSATTAPNNPGVAILALGGDLDASSYLQVIQRVDDLYKEGARALILDLTGTEFVSSSGLVAIHSIAQLMQGKRPPNPEDGWGAIRAIERGPGDKARDYVKLVNPQPRVASTLAKVGFNEVLETYPSVDAALAAL
jgi:anti-anti-sigma regulatory factor